MLMSKDLLVALREKAERDGLTRSAYIRRLLMRHVEADGRLMRVEDAAIAAIWICLLLVAAANVALWMAR